MAPTPNVCPECESEYVWTAVRCAHCDVDLVPLDQLTITPADEMPPASELSLVRAAGMGWVVKLSERLVEAQIPHRVDPLEQPEDSETAAPYGVFVRERDVDAARRIDAAHMAREIPEAETEALVPESDDCCPACGDPLSETDLECGGCGLAFAPAG